MKSMIHVRTVLLALLVSCSACRSPYYADKGAALGGVAGGLTGAALGDRGGNALGGALVGTAVGALAGAAIGDSMDAEVARRQALIEAKTGRRMAGAVTTADVSMMVSAGLSDDIIVNHIHANGVAATLTPGDIIQLHDSGVSEKVINAMQQAGSRPAEPVTYVTPVVVEEPYVVAPIWHPRPFSYGPPCPPHHYVGPPRQSGVSWGFSYHN